VDRTEHLRNEEFNGTADELVAGIPNESLGLGIGVDQLTILAQKENRIGGSFNEVLEYDLVVVQGCLQALLLG